MNETTVTLKQLNLLRLSRDAIQKWYKDPAFNSVLRGLYCRVVVRDTSAQKYYRVGLVECIRVAETPSADGCSSVIVEVAYGKQRKNYALDFVSNGAFTAEEASQYFEAVQRDGTHMLTFAEVEEKLRAMKDFVARCRTDGREGQAEAAPAQAPAAPVPAPAPAKREPLQAPVAEKRAAADEAVPVEKEREAKRPRNEERRVEPCAKCPRKDRQVEDLQYALQRLEREVEELKGEAQAREAHLVEERDAGKKHKMKVKEMDIVISSQAELIKALQAQLANEREMLSVVALEGVPSAVVVANAPTQDKRRQIAVEYKEMKEKCQVDAGLG